MKRIQQLCAATLLVLTPSLSAMAGEMGTPGATQPPPSPDPIQVVATAYNTAGTTDGSTSFDTVTSAALDLLIEVLF